MILIEGRMLPCSSCLQRMLTKRISISHPSRTISRSHQRPVSVIRQKVSNSNQATQCRALHASSRRLQSFSKQSTPREERPVSDEPTQTDFSKLDVLGNVPLPASSIDSCRNDGFILSNGVIVEDSGMLLVGGEVFRWSPWNSPSLRGNVKGLKRMNGQWHIPAAAWGILDLIWPKPDLLVIGTGSSIQPLSPETRRLINDMGIRLEVLDTRNAAAQYNLLATERGVHEVAAAMVPIGRNY